uniref:Uncharacterized protein n=1 Tax=Glossina palpalis gambiensis TaxID=67801 RepID=A0A1B0BLV6_9MUSC
MIDYKRRVGSKTNGLTTAMTSTIPNRLKKICITSIITDGKISSICPISLENLLSIRPEGFVLKKYMAAWLPTAPHDYWQLTVLSQLRHHPEPYHHLLLPLIAARIIGIKCIQRLVHYISFFGISQAYILITWMPDIISFIIRTRSSVRKAVRKRKTDVLLPSQPCSGININIKATPKTAAIFI